jgi:hypothetical protein
VYVVTLREDALLRLGISENQRVERSMILLDRLHEFGLQHCDTSK